jgi:hypothetical protein
MNGGRRRAAVGRGFGLVVVVAVFGVSDIPIRQTGASVSVANTDAPSLVSRIPKRPHDAVTGTEFVRWIRGMTSAQRRQAIYDQLLTGNIPDFLRDLRPVELESKPGREPVHRAVIWVMPDYLAIGSDRDFVRMPMGLYSAVSAARRFAFILPTRKMVDAIHRQADIRLKPRPMSPGPWMTSPDYLMRHNQIVEQQLAGRPRGTLVSGHKKDLVLTNRLAKKARRVAIYGWEYADGTPIQPLSTVHDGRYADYSHGVRLVASTVFLDGVPRSVFDILEDPELAGLLSYEGPIRNAREVMNLPFTPPAPVPDRPSSASLAVD